MDYRINGVHDQIIDSYNRMIFNSMNSQNKIHALLKSYKIAIDDYTQKNRG